jgi:DNA-binding transcriptional ArsR family regulator
MTATTSPDALDRVFRALADPTRRAVVQRLGTGSASTTELARPFEMALTSFAQHMRVLEHAGLVRSMKVGRVRTYRLDPAPLQPVADWLAAQGDMWARRLDQLDAFLLADGTPPVSTPASTPDSQSTLRSTDLVQNQETS